jgi:hypothetical protein
MDRLFWVGGLLAVFLYFKGFITGHQLGSLVFYVIFLWLPIIMILEPLWNLFIRWNIKRRQRQDLKDFIAARLASLGHQDPVQPDHFTEARQVPPSKQGILSPAQISQLNTLREHVSLTEAARFPKIRITGSQLPNLVPEAGVFTSKIKRQGQLMDIVLMLASLHAVADFARLLEINTSLDFAAEGYLLPSRTGMSYSVLLVTSFRFAGKQVSF